MNAMPLPFAALSPWLTSHWVRLALVLLGLLARVVDFIRAKRS